MKKIWLIVGLLFFTTYLNAQLTLIHTQDNKYGFVNAIGDTVVPPIYDYAEPFSEGLALVKKLKGYKLIDTLGRLWDISELKNGLGFRYDWGVYHSGMPILIPVWDCKYIDATGHTALKIPYRDAESFHGNKAKVYKADKYAYINHFGMIIQDWQELPDDYRAVQYKGYFGFVNKNGKLVIDYQYIKAYDFKNGIAKVSPDGQKWAIINKKGKYISRFYNQISNFENGVAIVKTGRYYGFINNKGRFLSGWYDKVEQVDSSLYRVKRSDRYALVSSGYQVTKWYDDVERYNEDYWIAQDGNKFAFLNKYGAYVVGWYNQLWIDPQNPQIILVRNNNKYGFYNVKNFYISAMYDSLVFREGIALVELHKKFGFINMLGKPITKVEFDRATPFHNSIATVEKDGKVSYINPQGKMLIDWIDKDVIVKSPPPGLYLVKIGDKYGFQTINGRRVIPAIYDYAEPFSEGLALIKFGPKKMLIDTMGNLKPLSAYPGDPTIRLDWGYRHSGKPIIVTTWQTIAFINPEGKRVLLVPYQDAESFRAGKAKVYKGDKYNYINKKGKLLGQWQELPDDYHIVEHNGKFGYINKNDHLVIPYKFDYGYDFVGGIAKVKVHNKWGYINTKGELITDLFDEISNFQNNIATARQGDKYALIARNGKILSAWYDHIYPFHQDIARVRLNNKYSFINNNGERITEQWFDDADDFFGGLAKIKLDGKWGFINTEGKIIVKPQYEWASSFIGGIAKVSKNGEFTLINNQGKQITDWFDRIFFFSEGLAVVAKDGKWGYIDINGHVVIPLQYDRAFAFTDGKALVIKGNKQFYIDKQGQALETDSHSISY